MQGPSPDYSLSERDTYVLSLIDEEDLTTFTFDGLKRRLCLHSETLSRIRSRLEEEGIVERITEGHEVTPKLTKLKLNLATSETQTVSLLQTFLPSNMLARTLISKLKGRWFRILRWLGISENCAGIILKWVRFTWKYAGLAMGDVIFRFNGKPVTNFYYLPRLLAEDVIGKEIKLIIIRREKLLELRVTPTSHGSRSNERPTFNPA